jgi:hypothetical protein
MQTFLVVLGVFLSGEVCHRIPPGFLGLVFGTGLATGIVAAKALRPTTSRACRYGTVVIIMAFSVGQLAGCTPLDVPGVALGVGLAVLTGFAGHRILRQEAAP